MFKPGAFSRLVTRLQMDNRGIVAKFPVAASDFHPPKYPRLALRPTWVRLPGREHDHPLPYRAQVMSGAILTLPQMRSWCGSAWVQT